MSVYTCQNPVSCMLRFVHFMFVPQQKKKNKRSTRLGHHGDRLGDGGAAWGGSLPPTLHPQDRPDLGGQVLLRGPLADPSPHPRGSGGGTGRQTSRVPVVRGCSCWAGRLSCSWGASGSTFARLLNVGFQVPDKLRHKPPSGSCAAPPVWVAVAAAALAWPCGDCDSPSRMYPGQKVSRSLLLPLCSPGCCGSCYSMTNIV